MAMAKEVVHCPKKAMGQMVHGTLTLTGELRKQWGGVQMLEEPSR